MLTRKSEDFLNERLNKQNGIQDTISKLKQYRDEEKQTEENVKQNIAESNNKDKQR